MAVVDERRLWLQIRQAMLMMVDAIEAHHNIEPRTSELRRERKEQLKQQRRDKSDNG